MVDIKNNLYISTFSSDAFNLAKNYNVGLEINHTCISSNLDDLDKLEKEIKNDISGIDKLILHGPFTEIHPAAIDHLVRDIGLTRLNEAYEIARRFKIEKMVVHTGWIPFIYFKEYQVEKSEEFFNEFLKDKEIEIALENVLEDEPYTILKTIERVNRNNFKIALDIGHLNVASDIDVITWIDVLGSNISHFHIHNNFKDKDSHNRIDYGSMDILKVFEKIDEKCKDVTFTIEAKDAKGSLEFLRKEGLV